MNWDYTKKEADRQALADPKWALERQILYGEGKLNHALLERYLPELNIPPERRAFLELLLWNKPF
jgi:hypothetical protein